MSAEPAGPVDQRCPSGRKAVQQMTTLHLVSVADNGAALLLADDSGQQYVLRIDDRLRAALRGDRLREGQLEIAMTSQLRPRDIQARVRAGDSVEEVAEIAGISRERVLRFAAPVLDERAHVADRARRALLRTDQMLELGPLGEVVETAVSGRGEVDSLRWDAWRREDGRWLTSCRWIEDDQEHTALWVLDSTVGSVTPIDDDARILSGLPTSQPTGPTRLAVVPDRTRREEQAPSAEPAAEDDTPTGPLPSVAEQAPQEQPGTPSAAHPARRGKRSRKAQVADEDRLRLTDLADHVEETEAPTRRTPGPSAERSRPQRPPVPSWDEIMFGRRT